jgi:hypothetical protein
VNGYTDHLTERGPRPVPLVRKPPVTVIIPEKPVAGRLAPHEVARAAHRIETDLLPQQSGVQDQLASAHGGINYIEILEYPHAIVSPCAARRCGRATPSTPATSWPWARR